MSFFTLVANLPRDRGHNTQAPGFGQAPNPFADLSRRRDDDDEEDVLDFEDTYDGLGDQLDEADDAFNDDTFGADSGGRNRQDSSNDFDFSGQTAKIARTMQEEQMLYDARQPPPKPSPLKQSTRPARTGYEKYDDPEYIPKLEADASLWGIPQKRETPESQGYQAGQSSGIGAGPSRKMMSLEEVEAAIRAQRKGASTQPQPPTAVPSGLPGFIDPQPVPQRFNQPQGFHAPPHILQRHQLPHDPRPAAARRSPDQRAELLHQSMQPPHILQRDRPLSGAPIPPMPPPNEFPARVSPQPRQILQNTGRLPPHLQPHAAHSFKEPPRMAPAPTVHNRGPSVQGLVNPEQLPRMSEEERAAFLSEEAKRAKRNHKIYMLSKDNGLMTPQDKNFVTRIQLQQLVTATGKVDEHGADPALAEDFYYHVYSQIRGAPRQSPHQPPNTFAQTYLFQTGGRAGRRNMRGGDNHMARMQQQVQRAVEAAKLKPKNKQLVIEGSLGKISFSNAKTPKPLLNFKRNDSGDVRPPSAGHKRQAASNAKTDRKATLRNIENVYTTLMQLEDHERLVPPPPTEESSADAIQEHMDWRIKMQALNQQLWRDLKIMEPIIPNSPVPHPFIAILSHSKGKKAIPRVFRHLDEQQRVTVLTMIVIHLDSLDVIRDADSRREDVELFSQAVMPSLFSYVDEAPLPIVIGLLGLLLDRVNIQHILRTRIGVSVLTMLISRAELIKQAGGAQDSDWEQWTTLFNRLFDMVEPVLPIIFPSSNPANSGEEVYIWQFLAALGAGSNPEQQQRLVIAVKDKVMDTVQRARILPDEMGRQRLAEVNLFMRAIGLDVELLG